MAIGKDRPSWARRTLVLALLAVGIWLFLRGWQGATSPGQDEVLAAYASLAGIAPESLPEDPLGLVERWADDAPDLAVKLGDWEFVAGLAPPAAGGAVFDLEPDLRFVLVFLEATELEARYRRRYYVAARPTTPFASLRLYLHELGGHDRLPEPDKWDQWGDWRPPER